jgi:uncharacterized repeat protein (TIGR01451 family)
MKERVTKERRRSIALSCLSMSTLVLAMLMTPLLYNPLSAIDTVEAGTFGNIEPTSFELELMDKINENRSENGAGPLSLNTSLSWIARAHSQDMIDQDFFDHSSSEEGPFNGASFSQRVWTYAEYDGSNIGECIAWNSWGLDPEWCMSTWKGSSGHWNIIIDPKYTELGLGIIQGDYEGWSNSAMYTADFGKYTLGVDLTLDSWDIDLDPASPNPGDQVTITATVHNQGTTDAYPVNVKIYDGDPDSGGVLIETEKMVPRILIQDEYTQVNVIWDTQGKSGDHDIYIVVDSENIIYESDEANNRAYKTVSFGSPPNPAIHLVQGWNLVSFPYLVSDTDIDVVLSSISGEYDEVQSFDSFDSEDPWKNLYVSKPQGMNDLSDLSNEMGFWIHIPDSNGADLVIDGDAPTLPQNIQLKKGWNLVGFPSSSGQQRNAALNNLEFGVEIDTIQYYDETSSAFSELGVGDSMNPEKGYFFHATQDCEWILNYV